MDISMDLDDPDLDAAIEQALAATEQRARTSARKRRNVPDLPDFDLGDDPERSMHIVVDETEGLEDGFDFLADGNEEDDEADDEFDFMSLQTVAAAASGKAPRSFDDLDRELKEAISDDEEADEGDLQAEMEKLLAESFGVAGVSDDDPDLAFPDFDDQDDDDILAEDHAEEEVFAAGDDGTGAVPFELQEENEALRGQVVELSRALSLRDLELRTAEGRVDGLEQQVVAAARQSAGVSREFEAFRRRSERDKEELQKFAGEKVLKEFLGVFDNLERALAHAGIERTGPLGHGVEMTLGQFMVALKRCGAERVPASAGTEFDPQFHEAVGQEFSEEVASGRIVHEMQAGFTLHTRLLRASMVSVSRGSEHPPAQDEAPTQQADTVANDAAEADATDPADEAPPAQDAAEAGAVAAPTDEVAEPAPKKKKKSRRRSKAKTAPADESPEGTDTEDDGADAGSDSD